MRWWSDGIKMIQGLVRGGAPSRSGPEARHWDVQRTLRRAKALAAVTVVLTIVLGWAPARRGLEAWLNEARRAQVTLHQVHLLDAPAWMPEGFQARLRKLVADQVDPDPMSGAGLEDAVAVLYGSGWVEHVEYVKRSTSGVIVKARYRTPAAFVREGEGYRLVDRATRRLPGVYGAQQAARLRLPVIVGAAAGPERDGQAWPDQGVAAALDLVELLADQPYARQVRAVDVGQRDRRGRMHLKLLTERGTVVWGLAPGQERGIEPTAAVKKAWLMEVYRQQGAIDAGGATVEVFGPAPFVRPSAASAERESPPSDA